MKHGPPRHRGPPSSDRVAFREPLVRTRGGLGASAEDDVCVDEATGEEDVVNSEDRKRVVNNPTDIRHLPAQRGKSQGREAAIPEGNFCDLPVPRPAFLATGRAPTLTVAGAEPSEACPLRPDIGGRERPHVLL